MTSWFYCKQIEVHHLKYLPKSLPWEYPDELLMTLCWICHDKVTKENKKGIPNK